MAINNHIPRFEPINPSTLSALKTPLPTAILTDPRQPKVNGIHESPPSTSAASVARSTNTPAALAASTTSAAAVQTISAAADTGQGLSSSVLIIAIVVPIVLIAVLIPLIVLLCLTSRRRRRRKNRCSHHSEPKPRQRSPARQRELLAHRPRGKYGPSLLMQRPDSFSGFEFNFSRPRTVLSPISARSPTAVTPMNATRSNTQTAERPANPRRAALSLISRYAGQERSAVGMQEVSPISAPPPPYLPERPVTLAHPYIPSPLRTPTLPDTPRSLSPQLQTATPMEIQRLSGLYAPRSQAWCPPQEARARPQPRPPRRTPRTPRSPLSERSDSVPPTSANLQSPFVLSPSPAPTDMTGLSFDPSIWIAAYERDSVVTPLDRDGHTPVNPHQMV